MPKCPDKLCPPRTKVKEGMCGEGARMSPSRFKTPVFLMKAGIRFWSGLSQPGPVRGRKAERPPATFRGTSQRGCVAEPKTGHRLLPVKRAGPQLNPTPAAGR